MWDSGQKATYRKADFSRVGAITVVVASFDDARVGDIVGMFHRVLRRCTFRQDALVGLPLSQRLL
jgi:hypothetical protein